MNPYDPIWLLIDRLESLERTMAAYLKYAKQAREDLEKHARDSESKG